MAIEQPVDQVKVSGPAAAGADSELAGEMGLGAGCEGGDFLMPDMNPFDLALAAQRVGEPVEAVADDAVDSFDAGGDKLVRDRSCRALSLSFRPAQKTRRCILPCCGASSIFYFNGGSHARCKDDPRGTSSDWARVERGAPR
jgi:hypothetical protein